MVNPERYDDVKEAAANGGFDVEARRELAAEAFAHTAAYDTAVATWLGDQVGEGTSSFLGKSWERVHQLRYGENPHQGAALYSDGTTSGLANARQLWGKEMSYNNYQDTDAALRAAYDHDGYAVAVVKQANPCGVAVGDSIAEAHLKAHACDPLSAYGSVVAANSEVTEEMAARIHPISGGVLVQDHDRIDAPGDDPANWTLVAGEAADDAALEDLAFAWRSVRPGGSIRDEEVIDAAKRAGVTMYFTGVRHFAH